MALTCPHCKQAFAAPVDVTRRQQDVLQVWGELSAELKRPPTQQQVADRMGVSKVTAHEHLKQLVRKGLLPRPSSRHPATSRPSPWNAPAAAAVGRRGL